MMPRPTRRIQWKEHATGIWIKAELDAIGDWQFFDREKGRRWKPAASTRERVDLANRIALSWKMLSAHNALGWQSQYERVKRWHARMKAIGIAETDAEDTQHKHDDIYAFFQNCYHLKDWLEMEGVFTKSQLKALLDQTEMKVCRDICNALKHGWLDEPSLDSHFNIGCEYVPKDSFQPRPHITEIWFVICGSDKFDLFELADACMQHWDSFLLRHGVLMPLTGIDK